MFPSLCTTVLATLGVATTLLPSAAATALAGSGTISVLVGPGGNTSSTTTTPSDTVGCINEAGKVTLNDCAVYTIQDYHIYTEAGICSFKNTSQPTNADDYYGDNVHAFHCWDHSTVSSDTQFYTITGLPYTFMGQGDVDIYYDIPSLPQGDEDEIDIWYFIWGDYESDVPEGHYKALLLWEPTTSS